jgi:hypothetical protein
MNGLLQYMLTDILDKIGNAMKQTTEAHNRTRPLSVKRCYKGFYVIGVCYFTNTGIIVRPYTDDVAFIYCHSTPSSDALTKPENINLYNGAEILFPGELTLF